MAPAAQVVELWIGENAKGDLRSVLSASAEAGRGLEGDRYHRGQGSFDRAELPTSGRQLTLIEREAIEQCQHDLSAELGDRRLTGGDCRRNVVTAGVDLSALVGATFRLGGATLVGVRLCPPCRLLNRVAGFDALAGLAGRGGLRADITAGGTLSVGDRLEILEPGRGRLPP